MIEPNYFSQNIFSYEEQNRRKERGERNAIKFDAIMDHKRSIKFRR